MAKWFNKGEENEEEASALRNAWIDGRVELFAPPLIIYEVCNSIWKNPNLERDHALKLAKLVIRHAPNLVEIEEEEYEEAMALAKKSKVTFYDAVYIALSKFHKFPMLSSDNTQLEVAKGYTTSSHIRSLRNLLRT
jgi:predicted nucleic acid-binding protein